ncbi:cobalt-precorrin-5B (C1)-methyltransferase [Malonomonas rubra DSM 5091]|uniref:Cobalt-precorrin-5B C(1)-methyltransferase n=1 Tax=Malonomonas rubra DSM 5091 TaxID=1122189 RepID=A0A1M6GLW9_MALRU|nr:cobalt-precorrin-5B (C(1))-methyltransferase CbiD [Malonomonas rubra]SHJ10957.1 cobalt-precorrin-5B (C1)-methyltransferase [Malonomonas rubra DSM 5091]
MAKKELRSGYTTGACAAAAAKGAALLLRDGVAETVEIDLPAGFIAQFQLHGQALHDGVASCFVVKDAGDDPDITHGIELHAELRKTAGRGLEVVAGKGIGKVTKPGLAVPVGQAAINPVPKQMIAQALRQVFTEDEGLRLVLSIPDGEKRAEKTLNAKLGIIGGLSLLGTTGVVTPLSHKSWTDTIEVEIDVALATGLQQVVLSTGRTSELAARRHFDLPEDAFIMMGDFIGYTLEACQRKKVPQVALSGQFAKLLKIACGHPQTHVRHSQLDLTQLRRWAEEIGLDAAECEQLELANTARQIFEQYGADSALIERIGQEAVAVCQRQIPDANLEVLLVDYAGQVARIFS